MDNILLIVHSSISFFLLGSGLSLLAAILFAMWLRKKNINMIKTILGATGVFLAIKLLMIWHIAGKAGSLNKRESPDFGILDSFVLYADILAPLVLIILLIKYISQRVSAKQARVVTSSKWSIITALIVGAIVAIYMLVLIFSSKSSTAAIGIIFVPVYTGIAALVSFFVVRALIRLKEVGSFTNPASILPIVVITVFVAAIFFYFYTSNLFDIAVDKNSSAEELQAVFNNRFATTTAKASLAGNPNISVELMEAMIRDNNWVVLQELVKNPNIPVELLVKLAKNENMRIVGGAARNPNTPLEVLLDIASTKTNPDALSGVAANGKTPVYILLKLTEIPDFSKTSTSSIQANARTSIYKTRVYGALAKNPNSTPEILDKISYAGDLHIAILLARNPNTSCETFARLAQEKASGAIKTSAVYRKKCL